MAERTPLDEWKYFQRAFALMILPSILLSLSSLFSRSFARCHSDRASFNCVSNGVTFRLAGSWAWACPFGTSRFRFSRTGLSRICLTATHLKQTVQLRTIAAGERHLLFASNNVASHIAQA